MPTPSPASSDTQTGIPVASATGANAEGTSTDSGLMAAMEKALTEQEGAVTDLAKSSEPSPTATPTEFDPSKWTQDQQEQAFRHFQPQWSKQTAEIQAERAKLEEEKRSLLTSALDAIKTRTGEPVKPEIEQRLQKAMDEGDWGAVAEIKAQLAVAPAMEEMGAVKTQLLARQALERAVQMDPEIPRNQDAISARVAANPDLQELVRMNGFKYAPLVFTAINMAIKYENSQKNMDSMVKQKLDEHIAARRALAQKMGASGTSAGRTVTSASPTDGNKTRDEAMEAAWQETFGEG